MPLAELVAIEEEVFFRGGAPVVVVVVVAVELLFRVELLLLLSVTDRVKLPLLNPESFNLVVVAEYSDMASFCRTLIAEGTRDVLLLILLLAKEMMGWPWFSSSVNKANG